MAQEVSFKIPEGLLRKDLTPFPLQDLSRTLFFRVASRTFGPPKSRTRRIIAPPMDKVESEGAKPQERMLKTPRSGVIPHHDHRDWIQEGELDPSCATWLAERKRLQAQVDSMGNVRKWLQGKSYLTESEVKVQEAMSEDRTKSQKSPITAEDLEAECRAVNTSHTHIPKPTIHQPSPDALRILDSYLRQRRLRLVDLYNQADKRKQKNLSSEDFKAVRKEARMPVTDLQIENLVLSLSNKAPDSIIYKELSRGRSMWRKENIQEHHRNATAKSVSYFSSPEEQSLAGTTVLSAVTTIRRSQETRADTRAETSLSYGDQSTSSKSHFLQVPPADLGEMRPLSYEDMEEIGKSYRERKRRAKSNTRLLDWLEQCRVVRTGNAAIDAHSLPSTAGEEMGDLVEQHRRQRLQEYHRIMRLCQDYKVSLSEKLLERALLYPGDRLVSASGHHLMIRQSGTNTFSKKDLLNPEHAGQEASPRPLEMGSKLQKSQTPYPPKSYVRKVRAKVRGKLKDQREPLNCWVTFEQFQQMICNLERRFPYCFLTSADNAFWPGHLLEKLHVYLPYTSRRNQSHGETLQT